MAQGVGEDAASARAPSVSLSLSASQPPQPPQHYLPVAPALSPAMLQTLRLEDMAAAAAAEGAGSSKKKKKKKGAAKGGGGEEGEAATQHRKQRGASSSSSSSSASSTRSRRVLGMDEPTAVAAALVAMSAFMYSLESVNVKLLGKDVGFWTISVWRGVVGLVCCGLSYTAGRRPPGTHWLGQPGIRRFLALRGAMGAAAVISSFAALVNMDMADATSLMSTAPLWTALMAVLMNKGACLDNGLG